MSKVGKGICPLCGDRSLSYYVDTHNGSCIVDESLGKCDHLDSCKPYHEHPYQWSGLREYEKQYGDSNYKRVEVPEKPKRYYYLDKTLLDKIKFIEGNVFVQFLKGLGISITDIKDLFSKLNVYTRSELEIVFAYQDLENRFTRGMIIRFDRTGHKYGNLSSIHHRMKDKGLISDDFDITELHLWGLHLLNDSVNIDKPIAIVESQKTALLCNYLYPSMVWMASSGLSNLNIEKFEPLRGRRIIIYPDKGTYLSLSGKLNAWAKYMEFPDLEYNTAFENKYFARGYDMADYLAFNNPSKPVIDFDKLLMSENTLSRISYTGVVEIQRNIERVHVNGIDYYSRLTYTFSSMKKIERQKLLIDNENIVEVDAMSFHPRIVGKLFKEYSGQEVPEFLTGDSHTKLGEMLGVSRDTAKDINNSYWNREIENGWSVGNIMANKMDDFIIEKYPKLFDYMQLVKVLWKPIKANKEGLFKSYTNMSLILMDRDVRIMQELITGIYAMGEVCMYVGDAVYVKVSIAEKVKKMFDEVLDKHLK
jgi:hypothetical protein